MLNSIGLRASPCGEPMLVVNGRELVLSSRTSSVVLLSSFSVMRHASCPKMFLVFSSSFCLSMVSKALDMSMPRISISTSCHWVVAASHLCAQTASVVLRPVLNPLCVCDRTTLLRTRLRVMRENFSCCCEQHNGPDFNALISKIHLKNT